VARTRREELDAIEGSQMQVRRGVLFWGLFLIALGAVPLLVRAGLVDTVTLAGAWRLWPIILIAVGLGLVAGRTQVALVGTVVTAIILGIAGGAALATGNVWLGLLGDCSSSRTTSAQVDQIGSFATPATVRLELNCGDVQVSSHPGSAWAVHADYAGAPPSVTGSADRLLVSSPDHGGNRHQLWNLQLPSELLGDIDIQANAGSGTIDLSGARLASFTGEINAFDLTVDGSQATIDRIDVTMNAGRSRITLGSGAVSGTLSVNAGAIDLCAPAASQLHIRLTDQVAFAHNLDDRGLVKSGGIWTRTGTDPASAIDLTVEGAAASFTLDPDGGCR
jgi:hypothetical protein